MHERCVGDVTILDVGGRVTEEGAEALRALVQPLVRQGRVKIVFDLQDAPYIDTTALGEIVRAHATATRPLPRAEVMNLLHANLQDVFNENGVQIMSPNYRSDPAQPKIVPPAQWDPPIVSGR